MKKINTLEANAVVGGGKHAKVCVVEYVSGAGGACNAVKTCLNKHGRVVSQTITAADDVSKCPAGRP
jgi:orotate phosphoribosyltransferase